MSPSYERARRLDAALEGFLERRPFVARNLVLLGFLLLAALLAGGVVAAAVGSRGEEEEIVYAAADGSIVAVEPVSGERRVLYEGGASSGASGAESRFASAPTTAGGSRWISFSVMRAGRESAPRSDIYVVDPIREARARITGAVPGEAFVNPIFSPGRGQILAGRHERGASPNVAVMPRSGSWVSLFDPATVEVASPILSAAWISENALFAWRLSSREKVSLVAHDVRERRRATAYETGGELVGPLSYLRDSNTVVYAERARDAPLESARLKLLVGDSETPLRGAGEDLALYDPSPPAAFLDGEAAVMWTDGGAWGVGLLDLKTSTFRKTAVRVGPESRHPQVSSSSRLVATYDDEGAISVRRLEDGGLVRRIEGVQPPGAALARLREEGFEIPREASWFAPPSFAWRSLEK